MDLYKSYSHWGMFPVWTYPMREPDIYASPHLMYYDARYLHG